MGLCQISFDTRDAWLGLKRRPLRSLLSSFGIGIGVAALVAMLSISEGAKQKELAKITSLGTNTLRIENVSEQIKKEQISSTNLSIGLSSEDENTLKSWFGPRAEVGAYTRKNQVTIISGSHAATGTVLGVSSAWYVAERLRISNGRLHNSNDEQNGRSVCVIGCKLAKKLQVHQGTILYLENYPVRVIGTLAPKGHLLTEGTGLSSLDFDNTIIIPLSISPFNREISGRTILDGMTISLRKSGESSVFKTAAQVRHLLLSNHRRVPDFHLVIPLGLLREARESQKLFSLVMGSIAGLSLLVGGIGIMNVMLANITEQTREIGLRMAVGASRARIIHLYLWHAILLTTTGGLWGIGGGIGLAALIQDYAGWETAFSTLGLILAPLSAVLTGIIFGLHPAIRAASLDPAQALRDA